MTLTWIRALPGVRWLWRALLPWRIRFFQRGRYNAVCLERMDSMTLVMLPGVFNGVLLRSGRFLAQTLDEHLIRRNAHVLDVGTGSGINAIRAAQLGACVVGVDINPEAVRCAQINTLINHVEDQMQVRQGDVFSSVRGERFDMILFNPPFYYGVPRSAPDAAWRSEDAFERFLAGLADMLSPRGCALVVLSSDGDLLPALQSAGARGWHVSVVASQDLINERLTIYRIEREEWAGQSEDSTP